MGTAKVSKDFSSTKYADKEISSKAAFIVEKMTGNAHFATPVPPLDDITTAIGNYNIALAKVENG